MYKIFMDNRTINKNLNFYSGNNIKNLTSILLGSGLIYSFLYFFGYSFLRDYFSEIGGTMIPISDLPTLEIVILGLPPFILFLILFVTAYFLISQLFLLCNVLCHKIRININFNKALKFKLVVLLACLLLFYFLVINLFSFFIIKNNLPYNFFATFNKKIPLVEIIYKTSLINKQKIKELDDYDFKCEMLNIEKITPGKIRFLEGDNYFKDDAGNIKYVGNFELYFISKDNYYLKAREKFLNPDIFLRLHDINCDENKYKYVDVDGNLIISLYNFIVLPKDEIESIKYLNFDSENHDVTGFKDLFK